MLDELDYMEYQNNALAQLAYLSSNPLILAEIDYFERANDCLVQAAYPTNGHHAFTFVATAELDTAFKKWCSASLLLDGNSDYIWTPDSPDWDICSDASDWTIDCWVKLDDSTRPDETIITQYEDANNWWEIGHDGAGNNGLRFIVFSDTIPGLMINTGHGAGLLGWIPDANWHHVALCKVGTKYACYLDGIQVNYTDDADTDTFAGGLYIGTRTTVSQFLDGHIDEKRMIHSNIFGAAPVIGLTDTITPPVSAHARDNDTVLLLHCDGADGALRREDFEPLRPAVASGA